ncbi:pre-rRNA-processing protein las1-like [Cucurbita moschata]|uniref:Pre-rRNA-processing protein las1-like n=1 Tax=Cucurbita moschata TaxID=3662 RepID=A0A6J1FXW7_CUCMO|nr:pre-rRNA-processing protein las1-like [Cucurbita moschata]XP_022943516.1 pre-rRNA-processing protein las1-like [Cucurbita moschata]
MESLLELEGMPAENEEENSSSYSRKLVPWSTWSEWLFVSHSLFSDSVDSVAAALSRISTWRSRGCLPVVVEVTASIIEIQQKDPYFIKNQSVDASVRGTEEQLNNVSLSEEALAMLYCMAIMRLVNGVVEKTRKKTEVSIAVAADAIGLPRMLIDIRHEGSHRELPSLQVVRCASTKALCWLKSYYWGPQERAIPFQGDISTTIRKEIKSKLRHLAFNLKVKQNPQLESALVKPKRLKTKAAETLKVLIQLYSTFSSEFVSVLLGFLLKAMTSSDLAFPKKSKKSSSPVLDGWKLTIAKISNKEPELLLDLLQAVLEKIKTQEALEYENQYSMSSAHKMDSCQVAHLSSMFAWLVDKLKCKEVFSGKHTPEGILMELLRKCLVVSAPYNKRLMDSATDLAHLLDNSSLVKKLKKLPFLNQPVSHLLDEENPNQTTSENSFNQAESLREASRKLEIIKLHKRKNNLATNPVDGNVGSSSRWTVVSSWTPCPIGMLPRSIGCSGRLPVLDLDSENKPGSEELRSKENCEITNCCHKREASSDIQHLDSCTVKKMKETDDVESAEDVKGRLLIGGIWKKVGEQELSAIQSAVRILI